MNKDKKVRDLTPVKDAKGGQHSAGFADRRKLPPAERNKLSNVKGVQSGKQ